MSATCIALESDLTIQHDGDPIGERMVVTGRILDGDGRPVRRQLVEIWQANAGGRYIHKRDQHPAPLDPNFTGVGRCLTDDDGHYRFTTIKPGPYPWKNHRNAWRPAHIHFSLFGTDFTQRMITQMYFPGDPLFALDPIYQSITDQKARDRLVATYDHDVTSHEWATGYRWDIVLTGSQRTHFENGGALMTTAYRNPRARPSARSSATPCRSSAATNWCRPAPPVPSGCTAASPTVRATRCPMCCWRSGRPTPTAWSRAPRIAAPRRLDVHRLGPRRHRRRGPLQLHHRRTRATARAAPFIAVTVFARGLLNRLFTRAYVPGDRLAGDPLLASVPADRRDTLIAVRDEHGLRFDIRLQGERETVFLRYPGHP